MFNFLADGARALTATSGLLLAGWLSLGRGPIAPILLQLTTGTGAPPVPSTESILEFGLRQGGAVALLLVVLFFYRRDYRDLTTYRQQRDAMLVDLVADSTKANTEMAAALRENNIVVHQAKNVIRDYIVPNRRSGDTPLPMNLPSDRS